MANLNRQRAAIYAIDDAESSDTVAVLKGLMGTEKDSELRKAIVYALADVEPEVAVDALLQLSQRITIRKYARPDLCPRGHSIRQEPKPLYSKSLKKITDFCFGLMARASLPEGNCPS
jgi:hypothetical protein